jgi:hypothetical protein
MIWCNGIPHKYLRQVSIVVGVCVQSNLRHTTLFVEFHVDLTGTDFVNIVR